MSERAEPVGIHHAAKPATDATRAANAASVDGLDLDDRAEHERATRGFLAAHPTGRIDGPRGRAVWDTAAHDFVRQRPEAPDTVNPSLWHRAGPNGVHGLFEVADGVWQVRGYDLSNVTFVAGDRGWVVIDPLTSTETAAAALALANQHLGARPVTGVIYTHSHVLGLANRALHHTPGRHRADAAATVTMARSLLLRVLAGETTFVDEVAAGTATIDGDATVLVELVSCLVRGARGFAIVEP